MPNYDVHKKIGFLVSIVFTFIVYAFFITFNFEPRLLWGLPIIYLYSLIPDIDHHMSKIRKYIFRAIFFFLAISFIMIAFFGYSFTVFLLTLIGMLGLIVTKLRHRGATHRYLFVLLFAIPLIMIHPYLFPLGFIAGASHIFVDRFWSRFKRRVKRKLKITGETHIYIRV